MRIHRLIPLLVLLIVLALTTVTTFKHSPVAVQSGTAIAQEADKGEAEEEPTEADGVSTFPLTETKEDRDCDLYLDAAEVERRAKAEQAGEESDSRDAASTGRVPLSFKQVALPLAGGLDHAVAGVATRNSGSGVIRLRGVPPGSQLVGAVLIWGEITNQLTPYTIGFGPTFTPLGTFTGNIYGTTQQPCWNSLGVYAGYITNVTSQINLGINGDYQVKGLRTAIANNRCPWTDAACGGPANGLVLSEGASLIVFYTNPCIPLNAQVYFNLGPQFFFGGHSVTHWTPGFPILPNMQTVKHSRIGADGQVTQSQGTIFNPIANPSCGLRSSPLISDERTWIVNSAGAQLQIKGDGAGLNRDSDWNGYDGEPLNKLWDTHTDVFANSNFLAVNGGLNYTVRYQAQGDCIVWAAHILGIR
ncbi:MAG TPA: hypothetical protein VFM63_14780 [Pyrinomonadaceae bacterium]|nr:hypothetical protein [Pyrinomonadaceae bacterium]